MKADELFLFGINQFGCVFRSTAVPGEAVHTVPFIYFIRKPFLEAGRVGEEIIKYCGRAPDRKLKGVQLFFAHR